MIPKHKKYKRKEEFGMWVNWKRFSFGAFMLASLSLLLFGCGDLSGTQTSQKTISGVVSGSDGKALANATVTAYGVDANRTRTVLSKQVQSSNQGLYSLQIPAGYSGQVEVVATTQSASKLVQLAKTLFLGAPITYSSLIPASQVQMATIPPVMISFATNMVVQYLIQNTPAGSAPYTEETIKSASIVLENFFGANFAQTPPPPPAGDGSSTPAQQDLIVSIQAIGSITNSPANLATVVGSFVNPNGIGAVADQIKTGITAAVTALAAQGVLPIEYVPSATINTNISNAQDSQIVLTPAQLQDNTPPAAPTGLALADPVTKPTTSKNVNLIWNASATAAGYFVYRADDSGVYLSVGTVNADTSFSDFLVLPATAYSYRIVAFDNAHNQSGTSNILTVSTPAAVDNIPPTVPTSLALVGAPTDTAVKISWAQSTKTSLSGVPLPATSYNVYRDSQLIATTLDTNYLDTGLTQSTNYTYFIKAADQSSNLSAASQSLTVRTKASLNASPPEPPVLGAAVVANSGLLVSLSWAPSTPRNDGDTVTYNVYRNGTSVATGLTGTQYNDGAVLPGSTYSYTVTASENNAESAFGLTQSATLPVLAGDTGKPTAPSNLASVGVTGSSVTLTWTASTKATGDRIVAGYTVWRNDPAVTFGPTSSIIGTVTKPGYVDTTVVPSHRYTYYVVAFSTSGVRSADPKLDGSGNPIVPLTDDLSKLIGWTVDTTVNADITSTAKPLAPGKPVHLDSDPVGYMSWTDSDTTVTGYIVYRNGTQIADVAASAANFTDTTMGAGQTYTYTVKAYNAGKNLSDNFSEGLVLTGPAVIINTYAISGTITFNGKGLKGVHVIIGSNDVQTDDNGNYKVSGLINDTYTVTPSPLVQSSVYVFTPVSRTASVFNANVSGLNFSSILTSSVTNGVSYPDGSVVGGITVPAGSIVNGVTYPNGGTFVGGVFYPTGTVVGGISYPNGVIIGGITYPAGTIVGGVALPVGATSVGVTFPTGTVIGGIIYPRDSVNAGLTFPNGGVVGTAGFPSGVVIGGAVYPSGVVAGHVVYPTGGLVGGVNYPNGSIVGGISVPAGSVIGGVTYPNGGTFIGGIFYPTGTVLGGITYPGGVVIGGVSYPAGTVVGGIALPVGSLTTGLTFPSGNVIGGVTYPTGTSPNGSVNYPGGVVVGGVTYPTGTVFGGLIYPAGSIFGGVKYPNGTLVGGVTYPSGSVVGGVSYPSATVIGGVTYPTGTVLGGVSYPNGVTIGTTFYPAGTVVGGVAFPVGAVAGTVSYPAGSLAGAILYPGTPADSVLTGSLDYRYIVSGTVTDGTNAIAGAVVSTGTGFSATTNFLGGYTLYLPVGTYTLTATYNGSSKASALFSVDATTSVVDGVTSILTLPIITIP